MEQCAACISKCLRKNGRGKKTEGIGRYSGDFIYLSSFMAVWGDKSAGKYSEENGDQMKRKKWIILGMSVVLLTECSEKKAAEVSADTKKMESTVESEQNVLDFVDAHGEHYSIEINEAVKKKPYDNTLFVKDDNKISYEDDKYTSRIGVDVSVFQGDIDWEQVKEAGYDAMIYSNMLWEAYELDLEKLSDYPIWYADYEALPQTPYRFCMWQYSSTGSVPGIEGNVDLNIQLLKK